jgi:spore coat protein U-like protein
MRKGNLTRRMIKMTITLSMSLGLVIGATLLSTNQAKAGSSSASQQATATLSSSCTLSAQNLSFGNLVLPLSAQSASTSMSVLCSKNHSYTVALAYGGVYGQGTGDGSYWEVIGCSTQHVSGITPPACGNYYIWWYEFNAAGTQIGSSQLYWPTNQAPTGVTGYSGTTTPLGTKFQLGSGYSYGLMTGVAKGDHVAYSIQVPGNSAEVWNAGNYSYTATGTGATQSIPVTGKIVPAQSGSNYPTPDMYMDTVTTTVSF